MPFKIPSLEEARQRQEDSSRALLRSIPPPSSSEGSAERGGIRSGDRGSAYARRVEKTTRQAPPGGGASAAPPPSPPAPPPLKSSAPSNLYVRRNPYAKPKGDGKKSIGGSGECNITAAGGAASSSTSGGAAAKGPRTNPYGRATLSSALDLQVRPPPDQAADRPVGETFSQTFDPAESADDGGSVATASGGRSQAAGGEGADRSEAGTPPARGPADKASVSTAELRASHAHLQPHVLHVSMKQRGNPALQYIRNVPYAHANMVPDYIFASNRCALFLSLKYHNLRPNYVHKRIAELGRDFDLRILLLRVDVEDNAAALLALNKLCVVNDLTLVLAWSDEECGRYLETYKAFEGKDASLIKKKEYSTYAEQVADVLSTVRSVNKTDAAQLLGQFGNLRTLMSAQIDELSLCPGIGEKKVRRLWEAFHRPFSTAAVKRRKEEREEQEAKKEEAGDAAASKEVKEKKNENGIGMSEKSMDVENKGSATAREHQMGLTERSTNNDSI